MPLIGVVLAGALGLGAPALLRGLLTRFGVLDVPSARSSHSTPTLRGGGVAALIALAVGGSTVLASISPTSPAAWGVLIVSLLTGLLGLIEDVRGISIVVRAGSQLALGLALATWLALRTDLHWVLIPLGTLFFAAYVNFANFMDGINGISALHGLAVGSSFALAGWLHSIDWVAYLGLALAAAFITFLPWNLSKPGMFLGDVGSYLLGGLVAGLALGAVSAGVPLLTAIAPLSVYVSDASYTLLRRVARKEKWYAPHRQHVYQRLVDQGGMSHIQVALLLGAVTALAGVSGVLLPSPLGGILAITIGLAYAIGGQLVADHFHKESSQ